MAKIPFSKLDIKINTQIDKVSYVNTKNENYEIEVRCYLPIEEKMELISTILNKSVDDNGYYNPVRLQIFTAVEMMYAYTNLTFSAKQKENVFKLYDQLISSGLFEQIVSKIPNKEWESIQTALSTIITNIYTYKNSIAGILDILTTEDYTNLQLDATKIQKLLGDPENMEFLREVLTKLG